MNLPKTIALILDSRSSARERRRLVQEGERLALWFSAKLRVVLSGRRGDADITAPRPDLILVGRRPMRWPRRASHSLLLEQRDVPVLVLPRGRSADALRFQSLLVPLSGETSPSAALEFALRLGSRLKLPVDILHVTLSGGCHCWDESLVGHASDEAQHEYPLLQDEFVAQASPYSTVRERQTVRDFLHCTGAAVDRVLETVGRKGHPLVVLEWKGSLAPGRARVIKRILESGRFAVYLVREGLVREGAASKTRIRLGKGPLAA